MDELLAALSKRGLAITQHPQRGRCLYTAKDFSPGEVIISQEPYVSVPGNSSTASRCEFCFASSNLKRCSSCHGVWYCRSTCQKSDWKLHRVECQALSKLEKERLKSLTPSVRLMVKLYLRRKLESEKVVPASVMDNYKLVEALASHMSEIEEKQLILYAQMANLVNAILKWSDVDLKEIAENFSKLACNGHSICDPELKPLGTGLYLVVSIINHSCLPNSVLVFEDRKAVVRAVEFIPKGTEVLISYIDTAGSTITREKALKEQYFFTCSCPRCIKLGQSNDIQESAIVEGYRCKDEKCGGFLLRDSDGKTFICQQCGLARTKEDIKKIASEVKLMTEKANALLNSRNFSESMSLYKAIEELQVEIWHPSSLSLMQTRDSLLKIFMELNLWNEALAYCRLTIPTYERIYPGCHPVLGLQYYTCGKLEWFLGDTDNSIRSFTKALDILRITHGSNTPFVKELAYKLDEARAEASHKLMPMDDK
ncbi:hypothetical protein Droror1_Dr00027706 [Drosera rotundifolia]